MDDGRGAPTPGGMFSNYPSFGGGALGGTGSLAGLSPYLNVDPSYLQTQAPEFISNSVSLVSISKGGNLLLSAKGKIGWTLLPREALNWNILNTFHFRSRSEEILRTHLLPLDHLF